MEAGSGQDGAISLCGAILSVSLKPGLAESRVFVGRPMQLASPGLPSKVENQSGGTRFREVGGSPRFPQWNTGPRDMSEGQVHELPYHFVDIVSTVSRNASSYS